MLLSNKNNQNSPLPLILKRRMSIKALLASSHQSNGKSKQMKVYIKQIEEDFIFFAGHFQPIDWSGNNRMQYGCDHSTTKMIQNIFFVI